MDRGLAGPSKGLKMRGGGARSTMVGIICLLGWDRVNCLAKHWGGGSPLPPTPLATALYYILNWNFRPAGLFSTFANKEFDYVSTILYGRNKSCFFLKKKFLLGSYKKISILNIVSISTLEMEFLLFVCIFAYLILMYPTKI